MIKTTEIFENTVWGYIILESIKMYLYFMSLLNIDLTQVKSIPM